jgi:hypothetical protein
VLATNLRLYTPTSQVSTHDEVDHHLRFLRGELDRGLGDEMQRLFPEGYFFSYVLYGLSWVNVALLDPDDAELKEKALREARHALAELDTPAGRAPFSAALDLPYGAFYVGWSNYLRAGLVLLDSGPTSTELAELQQGCDDIVATLKRSASPFLASYPGQSWPVDMYPAMLSVKVCGSEFGAGYDAALADWLDEVDATVDPGFGLVAHRTEPFVEHPRATSQTLIQRFLTELDPERAAVSYERFQQHFVTHRLGMPALREHPQGIDAGGDVDSGPLVLGTSASATVVAIATAQTNNDDRLASALKQELATFGVPVRLPGGTRYALGALPIGDLFAVWARTSHGWLDTPSGPAPSSGVVWWWRVPTHLLSVAGVFALWFVLWPGARGRLRLRARTQEPKMGHDRVL